MFEWSILKGYFYQYYLFKINIISLIVCHCSVGLLSLTQYMIDISISRMQSVTAVDGLFVHQRSSAHEALFLL